MYLIPFAIEFWSHKCESLVSDPLDGAIHLLHLNNLKFIHKKLIFNEEEVNCNANQGKVYYWKNKAPNRISGFEKDLGFASHLC